MIEEERLPPPSESIARFLEEESQKLNAELKLLAIFDPPVTRAVGYRRLSDEDFVEGEHSRWAPAEVLYLPPPLMQDGLVDLRAALDEALGPGEADDAVAVWITPFEAHEERTGLFLFFRDQQENEALYAAIGGPLRRIALPQERLERFIEDVIAQNAGRVPGLRRLAAELDKPESKQSLDTALKEAGGSGLSGEQWNQLVRWMTTAEAVTHAFIFDGIAHGTSSLEESHQLLRLTAHAVHQFMDRKAKEHQDALEAAEKNHDKKLHRMRADMAKLEMLFQGIKSRADRSDADNRELRRRVKSMERMAASAPAGSGRGEAADPSVNRVRHTLDALFT